MQSLLRIEKCHGHLPGLHSFFWAQEAGRTTDTDSHLFIGLDTTSKTHILHTVVPARVQKGLK